jgi:hypothetical protein
LKLAVLAARSSRHRPWYPVTGPVAVDPPPPLTAPLVILLKIVEYW